jgi:hypothetical protein
VTPKKLTQSALDAIAHHCNAHGFPYRKAEPGGSFAPLVGVHREITRSHPPAMPVATRELGSSGKPLMMA